MDCQVVFAPTLEEKMWGMALRSTVVILQSSQARQPTINALNICGVISQPTINALNICGVITFDLLVYIS